VALGFAGFAVAATWPLARYWTTSLPSDLGDPLFVTWVMAWVARHVTAMLTGDFGAFARMWDAPIFAPETGTLTYSEHFFPQTLLALPVYWTGNTPIAAYNSAFLAAMWLSALGAYQFVLTLTGRRDGALVAGMLYGFNAYRLISLSHLHALSAQWAPFALTGLVIFARTGSRWALAGATAAWAALALSSVYYLAYFTPVLAAFAAVALSRHTGWRRPGSRRALAAAAVVAGAAILPFLWPYLQTLQGQRVSRPRSEVEMSSLTLDSYRAAIAHLAPMGALAALSLLAWRPRGRHLRWAVATLGVGAIVAFWLSLGPTPRWHGAPLGVPGLYGLLHDYVPGFDGLRVASRFAMVLMLTLAALAGIGVALLSAASRLCSSAVMMVALVAHVAAYWSVPLPRDVAVGTGTLGPVPDYLAPSAPLPDVYRPLGATAPSAIVVELPFGEPAYELRYMYFGLAHGRRLENGYSGIFPASYRARSAALRNPWATPDEAWRALAPASYVVVHAAAWPPAQASAVTAWLRERGARAMVTAHDATLWQLPPPAP
jgi:hypothetical protein